jgi:hypothetical protein
MSDMEQEWKPKARPQSCVISPPPTSEMGIDQECSTMAQDFSTALDSAFSLDSEVNHLSLSIDQK